MSGKYIPPHLRKKMAATVAEKSCVRFPSNTTGNNTRNVKYKRAPKSTNYNNYVSRSSIYKKISKGLATR